MKIIVIAPYYFNSAPSQRYRIEQWVRNISEENVEFEFLLFCDKGLQDIIYSKGYCIKKAFLFLKCYLRMLMKIAFLKDCNYIYLHREISLIGLPLLEYLLILKSIPVIYDFDDAIYLPGKSQVNRFAGLFKCQWKIKYLCRISSCITVGNRVLSDYALRFNKNVLILPSSIDTAQYTVKQHSFKNKAVVGWTGSHSVCYNLSLIKEALAALKKRIPYDFVLISDRPFDMGIEYKFIKWNPDTEVEDLSLLDIGIMPLFDSEWERGKCGLKILQYMGIGIPAVASPVGVNKDIIIDQVNGFLPNSIEEWVEVLSLLIKNPSLRERIGAQGRKTVESSYSAKIISNKLLKLIQSMEKAR